MNINNAQPTIQPSTSTLNNQEFAIETQEHERRRAGGGRREDIGGIGGPMTCRCR